MSVHVAPHLTAAELRARASRTALVLTDCDGVLTDAGVYYSDAGKVSRRFSVRDGMGVERLREVGVATGLVSRENCGAIAHRARKLALPYVHLGVRDKLCQVQRLSRETGLGLEQIAFIGDDVNDLEVLRAVGEKGLTAAPADAMPGVRRGVHHVCRTGGGRGAFREFAEWILALRAAPQEGEEP